MRWASAAGSSSGFASRGPSLSNRRSSSWTSRAARSTRSPRAKIEELIYTLKERFTIVIVTHNMQQAGRCSDYTAFFYLGQLIEHDRTVKIFTSPREKQTEDYITGRFG